MPLRPVSVYVSRSADGGRTWTTVLLDVSSAPPSCEAQYCETGFLGAQIALASDAAGSLYALWNAGAANGGPERIYFSSSTTAGGSWSERVDVSNAVAGVEHAFPAVVAGVSGDVRIAWMDARASEPGRRNRVLWNTFYPVHQWRRYLERRDPDSRAALGYDYILPGGFRFPFGDYFGLAIDSDGATHAVWGEGRDYKAPGSIWYASGR